MTIALSHGGRTVYRSGSRSQEVLVGTAEGIVTIERADDGWRVAAETLAGKHISAILIEPESAMIFAGSYNDGLYASRDGGSTWDRSDHGIGETNIFSLEAAK